MEFVFWTGGVALEGTPPAAWVLRCCPSNPLPAESAPFLADR